MSQSTVKWTPIIGQRVKLSAFGRSVGMKTAVKTGIVVNPAVNYPNTVRVLRDGSKIPQIYHTDYWEIGK